MAGFGNVPTQLGRAIKPPAPARTRFGIPSAYGRPNPALQPAPPQHGTGASLSNLHNPSQGSGFSGLTAAPAPAAPQTPAKPPSAGPGATPNSPLDATYYQQLASDQLRLQNSVNGLNAQSGNATNALQSALAQLAYQQPRDSLKLEQGANNRGALYSSAYTNDLGNLGNSYQTRQTGATTANAQKQAGIAAQIAALNQAEPINEAGFYDAAVARQARAAAANPATGQPAIPPPVPQAVAKARTAASKGQAKSSAASKAALAKAVANARQKKTGFAAITGLTAGRR